MSILRLVRNFVLLAVLALAAHSLAAAPDKHHSLPACSGQCRACGSSTPCINHVACYCAPASTRCFWIKLSC